MPDSAMTDRLVRCFAAVFDGLDRDEIENARVGEVEQWDSLASVTLLAVLEEEFDVMIDDLDLPELTSFGAVQDYLSERVA